VKFVSGQRTEYRFATVEPLITSDPTGSVWLNSVINPVAHFPKRGFVHWHEAPFDAKPGSLWQFSVDEHPSAHHEQLHLVDPVEPIEVIDFRGWEDEMTLRSLLTGDGLELTPAPVSRRILLWLASGLWAGPVRMRDDKGQWIVEGPEGHSDPSRVSAWKPNENNVSKVRLEGDRFFLNPAQDLGSRAAVQNWAPDTQVLRGILKRLRRFDSEAVQGLEITDRVFEAYVDHLGSIGIPGSDPEIERARAARLRGIRDVVTSSKALIDEAATTLLQTPAVRESLDKQIEDERKRMLKSARLEVEQEMTVARQQLSEIHTEMDVAQTDLRKLQTALTERVAGFDAELSASLSEVAKRPEKMFAELAILRAALQPLNESRDQSDNLGIWQGHNASPSSTPAPIASRILTTEEELANQLAKVAFYSGIDLKSLITLHSTFRVGSVPVLIGSNGYDLCHHYASAVSAGQILWVPISPTTVDLEGLFGRYHASVRRIVPQATGMLKAVQQALTSSSVTMIVLDGFNRAPVEAYLQPILSAASAARFGDNSRVLRVADSEILSSDDPYANVAEFRWPPNLLIACIPSSGTTSLPIPAEMWRYFSVIDTQNATASKRFGSDEMALGNLDLTTVCGSLWASLIAREAVPPDNDDATLMRFASSFTIDNEKIAEAKTLKDLLFVSGLESDAMSIALTTSLLPAVDADDIEISNAIERAGIRNGTIWEATHNFVKQSRI
jgi:hypothetical protein